MILSGKIGVFDAGVSGASAEPFFAAVASAMAEATGTFVSKRQPAGTQPCFAVSGSMTPDPVGSRWTTHQPRALDKMMNVSPLFRTANICTIQSKRTLLTPRRQIHLLVLPCMDRLRRRMTCHYYLRVASHGQTLLHWRHRNRRRQI